MSSPSVSRARTLKKARHRREAGLALAEGPHVVAEALEVRGALVEIFASHEALDGDGLKQIVERATSVGVPIHAVRGRELAGLADTRTPQGVIGVIEIPPPPPEPLAEPGLWLFLDGVQDPGNVGTLLRAADAFGARGAITTEGTADLWGGKVIRAGQGAHLRLALLAHGFPGVDAASFLAALRAAGGELWTAESGGDPIYAAPAPPERVVVALGSEAHGLRPATLAAADRRVSVPQRGSADSLNVAMAGTVLLSWMACGPRGASR